MCDEILYLILLIISIIIINKICNIKMNILIIFIIIMLVIIYISKNNDVELFTNNVSDICNNVKNRLKDLISKNSKKCIKNYEAIEENKKTINDGIDCYNFVGNEIVTNNNIDSWCNLNDIDADIINKAIEKLN
jgi:hypothetical protein